MKVAILTTDNREPFKEYSATVPHFGTAPEALLQGFALFPDTEVHILSCARKKMRSPEKLASNIFFHSLYVPKTGWMRTLFLGCILAARKKLKAIRPDIVHGQGTEESCSISAVCSGFPNVLTIHGNMRLISNLNQDKPFSHPWLAARLEGFTVPRSRGVVCITRYTQQAMAGLAKRTWLLPNAVDQSFFELNPQPPPRLPARILIPAHVCLRKNQNAFIRALDPLAEKIKFEVLFLGKTSPGRAYDDEFLSLVAARPWCAHINFANREELRNYLRETTVLALPSLEDNCPMTVLEAMAAGVPVVAAKVGGVPDLIEAGETGIFCDPLDPGSMRAGIEKALAKGSGISEMARRAKLRALERFHPRVVAQRHLEIYRDVLASSFA